MALVFTSFNFDKAVYNPGDTITLTVGYTSDDLVAASSVASAVTVALSDEAGTAAQTSDGSASFPDFNVETTSETPQPTTVSAEDNRAVPGAWAVQSNAFSGDTAPFAGVAVLTSVA